MVTSGCRFTLSVCKSQVEMKTSSFRTSTYASFSSSASALLLQILLQPRGHLQFLLLLLLSLAVLGAKQNHGFSSHSQENTTTATRGSTYRQTQGEEDIVSGQAVVHRLPVWPNGTIPYRITIEPTFEDYDVVDIYRARILEAMEWWENATCVRFVKVNESDGIDLFVKIVLKNETIRCSASAGYIPLIGSMKQNINNILLSPFCLENVGNIAHELGHVIGLLHEHNRIDRDTYITVHFDNLLSSVRTLYAKLNWNYESWDTSYDLGSIMHYPQYSYDAEDTSLPIFTINVNFSGTVGQRECLSHNDISVTNAIYHCNVSASRTRCKPSLSPSNVSLSDTDTLPDRNLIFPGDHVALKTNISNSAMWNRWIGCSGGNYYAWGCPGPAFLRKRTTRCWEFNYTISSPDVATGTPLRYNDRVVLKQCPTSLDCATQVSLTCHLDGEQCNSSLPDNSSTTSTSTTSSSSSSSSTVFRLVSATGLEGELTPQDTVHLVEDVTGLFLTCNTSSNRRWQRKCQLQTSSQLLQTNHEHKFQIFKI